MTRVALRGIRAHFVRFSLVVLAVTLGVAFVAGTFSLRSLLADTFDGIVEGSSSAQAYIRGAGTVAGFNEIDGSAGEVHAPVPVSLVTEIRQVPGVSQAFADISGPLVLVGADGTAVATTGAPVMGLPLYPDDPSLRLVSGDLPTGPEQIALESGALKRSGLAVGDHTKIIVSGDIRSVTVTAELSFGAASAGAVMVGLDAETALADFAADGMTPFISILATDGVSEESVRDSVASFLADNPQLEGASDAQVVTGESLRSETRAAIDTMLGFVQVFLMIFALISLFVGGFLITNTFAMSVRERMREFALLRAMGASPSQVFASILIQAFVIGLLGSVLGIAAGVGLAAGLGAVLGALGMELAGSVSLTAQTVVVSLGIGTLMSVLAAAIPARRAASIAPVVAMRGEAPTERRLRLRAILGGTLVLLGASGVAYTAFIKTADGSVPEGAGAILGAGAGALIVGALICAPALTRRTVGLLAAPVVAWGKPLGSLARGNVVRNPRRTASTAGALMIGMTLVSAASVLAASATTSIDEVVRTDLKADFLVQGMAAVPEDAAAQIANLDSVERSDRTMFGLSYVSGAASPQEVVGVPAGYFTHSIVFSEIEGDVGTIDQGQALVDIDSAAAAGWQIGDTITLRPASHAPGEVGSDAAAEAEVRVGALVRSAALSAGVFLAQDVFDSAIPASSASLGALLVSTAPGVSPQEARSDIAQIIEPYLVISIADADDLSDQLAEQINMMLAIIYALLGLAIIIAVLGIVNTLALSIIERTREVALLRAVGLGRLQLASIIGIESILTAVVGTILGVSIGLGIASALPTVLADQGLGTLVVPWGQLAGMVALAAAVGLLASLWPAIRAARLPVLEGLAAD